MKLDIRWIQRLENYENAFYQLESAVNLAKTKELNDLEKQGLIKSFEYTFELAWNLIRDYFIYQGIYDIKGSRDAIKTALKYGIIDNGEVWFEIITTRNLTSHTYNKNIVEEVIKNIQKKYYSAFKQVLKKFKKLKKDAE